MAGRLRSKLNGGRVAGGGPAAEVAGGNTAEASRGGEFVDFEGGKHRVYIAKNGTRYIKKKNGQVRFVKDSY